MTTKATGIKRILKLADYMETVPKHKFDFSVIVGSNWGGKPDLSCGTTACALGWATTMPLFRRLGLYLSENHQVELKEYDDDGGWEDISREVFGISIRAMTALFDPSYRNEDFDDCYEDEDDDDDDDDHTEYPECFDEATPKQWARHARKIVKILQKN